LEKIQEAKDKDGAGKEEIGGDMIKFKVVKSSSSF
jgi:hypothetical protein